MIKHSNATFGNVLPFYIDDGELDKIKKRVCFALGVEWEMIHQELQQGEPFERIFHSDNIDRIEKLCEDYKAIFKIHLHDDWPVLEVESIEGR